MNLLSLISGGDGIITCGGHDTHGDFEYCLRKNSKIRNPSRARGTSGAIIRHLALHQIRQFHRIRFLLFTVDPANTVAALSGFHNSNLQCAPA
ncbi:hypothetical protein Dda3937_04371 [Dickeya dadantii 3937]|uniref:Uncharacterized protein n=1 Tax=Dickeya dadantii (strain 3937) TaxID=198628 RepID=E0SMB5_DICD3|nr:hypothetical protein Dda3937_04371 [Dickeya dadantii 3937]